SHTYRQAYLCLDTVKLQELTTMDNSYESNIDKEALDFIKTGHERNFKDASEITNVLEFILPAPPRIMFQSSSALKI
nr:hypothetical protein [Tanacetum cinerariifolium]